MIKRTLAVIVALVVCIFAYGCSHDNANQQTQIKENEKQLTKCASGEELKPDGSCGSVTLPTVCQSGEELKPDGTCGPITAPTACQSGEELKADGTCGPVTPPVTCPNGQTLDSVTGQCVAQGSQPAVPPEGSAIATGEWGDTCLSDGACNIGMKCDTSANKCVGKKEWALMESNIQFPPNFTCSLTVGNIIYVGTSGGGVFKQVRILSTGSQQTANFWTQVNTGLKNLYVTSLVLSYHSDDSSPDHSNDVAAVYAGTDAGVFKLSSDGTSWSEVNTGLIDSRNTIFMIISLLDVDNDVYASTNSGVFKLPDGGSSWIAVNTGLPNGQVTTNLVADADNNIYVGTKTGGVFVNYPPELGAPEVWTAVNSGLTPDNSGNFPAFLFLSSAGNDIYAATYKSGVFVLASNSGVSSWRAINDGLPASNNQFPIIFKFPSANNTVYALTRAATYKLNKTATLGGGGNYSYSWSQVSAGLPANEIISSVLSVGNSTFASIGTGIYKFTSDGSGTWTLFSTVSPLEYAAVSSVVVADGKLYAVTSIMQSNSGGVRFMFFKWDETNKKWSTAANDLTTTNINDLSSPLNVAISNNNIYVVLPSRVFKSTIDSNSNWSQIPNPDGQPVFSLVSNEGGVYAGTKGSVYKFVADGNSWTPIGPTRALGDEVQNIFLNGNDIYAGTYKSVYKFTISTSTSWSVIEQLVSNDILSFLLKDNDIYIGSYGNVFKRSVGSGSNFSTVGTVLGANRESISKLVLLGNDIYALAQIGIVYKFTLGSSGDWAPINLGVNVKNIAFFPHAIYAATNCGVWVYVE